LLVTIFLQYCRHQENKHQQLPITAEKGACADNKEKEKHDYLFNYHNAKLLYGLVLMEFNDAVKEGDGERLFELYKLCLLLYKSTGHTKYSYIVLNHLVKLTSLLSPFEAHRLKWNRFFNKHGGSGCNIPMDLRKEQLNKTLKKLWRSLGSNINENSASRVADTLEVMEQITDKIDQDCNYKRKKGTRNIPNEAAAVIQISSDLMSKQVFRHTPGRTGHPSFAKFDGNILGKIDYKALHTWMTDNIKLWASISEK
jgi:L1 cell adhesion molecule like protein